jgi:hypothetical protein
VSARNRSGTTANQNTSAKASATSAPREYENSSVTSVSPSSGYPSARDTVGPVRRAASHRQAGAAIAASAPTAFQYPSGSRSRASSAVELVTAGNAFLNSPITQMVRQATRTAVRIERPCSGASRAMPMAPANAAT